MKGGLLEGLADCVGRENVSTDAARLGGYFDVRPASADLALVTPTELDALSEAVGLAYEKDVPLYSHKRGKMPPGVASSGGVLFDLGKMQKIVRIDEPNLLAFIEYGVTFERMKEELDRLGLRLLMPAAATSSSVVRSYVDRDVILANGATRPYQYTIFHAVLADGRVWMSGNDQFTPDGHSEFREDFGPMYSNFFHASEDIFGIPYAVKAWVYKRWEERRVRAYSFSRAEDAIRAAYLVSRHDQVFECVAADSRYLSVLLSRSAEEADKLAGELAPWTLVMGFDNHPKLVEIWDRQTRSLAEENGGKPASEELAARMQERFELPWYLEERKYYRGDLAVIDQYSFMAKAPSFLEKARESMGGYEVGQVVIPMYYGAACYCETDVYHAEGDEAVQEKWVEAYRALLDMGAHLNRPTGKVAEMVWSRMDPENIRMIKELKKVLDPKGLLNPGQLMEGV
jgi:FAD/FMN-containing dehydrogenase